MQPKDVLAIWQRLTRRRLDPRWHTQFLQAEQTRVLATMSRTTVEHAAAQAVDHARRTLKLEEWVQAAHRIDGDRPVGTRRDDSDLHRMITELRGGPENYL